MVGWRVAGLYIHGLIFPGLGDAHRREVAAGKEYGWRLFIDGGRVRMKVRDQSGAVVMDASSAMTDAVYFYERASVEFPKPLHIPLEYWRYDGVPGNFAIVFNLDLDTVAGNWGGETGIWTAVEALKPPSTPEITDGHYPNPQGMSLKTYPSNGSYHIVAGITDNT